MPGMKVAGFHPARGLPCWPTAASGCGGAPGSFTHPSKAGRARAHHCLRAAPSRQPHSLRVDLRHSTCSPEPIARLHRLDWLLRRPEVAKEPCEFSNSERISRELASAQRPYEGGAAVTMATTTTHYVYDKSGRMTTMWSTDTSDATYFTYNQRDLVTKVLRLPAGGDATRSFTYNAAGERVIVDESGGTTPNYWTYDGHKLLTEKTSA